MDNVKDLEAARLQKRADYIVRLLRHGVSFSNTEHLSLSELRKLVDQYEPMTITSISGTASGGTSRSIKIITKKAA